MLNQTNAVEAAVPPLLRSTSDLLWGKVQVRGENNLDGLQTDL